MTEETRLNASGQRVVRRRRKSRSQKRTGVRFWLRGQHAANLLFAGMVGTSLAYAALVAQSAWSASTRYGPIAVGMSAQQVSEALGQPTSRQGATRWVHDNNGEVMTINFDPQGTVLDVTCVELHGTLERCPTTLGLDIGTYERDLKLKIGGPAREQSRGHEKSLFYPELGLSFQLQHGQVTWIRFEQATGTARLARLIGWMLIP